MNTQHLQKRRQVWYVRLVVPEHLRNVIGRRELIRTTRTSDLGQANRIKHSILTELQGEIIKAEANRDLPPHSSAYVLAAAHEARLSVAAGADEDDAARGLDATIENHLELLRERNGVDAEGDPVMSELHANAIGLAQKVFNGEKVSFLSSQLDLYLVEVAKAKRKQTVADKRRAVGDFQKWLKHDVEVRSITKQIAGNYFTEVLMRRNAAPATTRSTLSHISSFWAWMDGRGVVESNPWEKLGRTIVVSTRGSRGARRPWSNEELLKLLKATPKDDPLFPLTAIATYTGMRREEVCQLRSEDVEGKAFTIREGKTRAAVRSVPIHTSLQPLVARLMKQTSDGYLIPGLLTGGADAKRGHLLGKRFGNHIRREGFNDPALCFHTLRNAFINRIRSAGVQPHTIKQIVGHSEEDLTNQYAGIETPAELAKAMQKVSFGPLDAYLRETAAKVKVDAQISHRRPNRSTTTKGTT